MTLKQVAVLRQIKRMAEMCSHVVRPGYSGTKPENADFYHFPRWLMTDIDEVLAAPEVPMNCQDAGPGRGLCIECANGHYERCLYMPHSETTEVQQLRAALKVAKQAILEFSHAQEMGPDWYTRGASGMYAQVRMWLQRGVQAVNAALGPYDDSGRYLKEMPCVETVSTRSNPNANR